MREAPVQPRQSFLLKIGTTTVPASVTRIVDRLELDALSARRGEELPFNSIGRVWIETAVPVAFDPYAENRATGGFILIDRATFETVGGRHGGREPAARDQRPSAARPGDAGQARRR